MSMMQASHITRREFIRGAAARTFRRAFGALLLALAWPSLAAAQGLFVVSQNNAKVLKYDHQTGAFLSTFVEPITQGFQIPGGIAIHPTSGILYVSSTGTGAIWKYTTATGALITPAAATGLIQPGSVGFDPAGTNLYFVASATGLSVTTDAVLRCSWKARICSSTERSTLRTSTPSGTESSTGAKLRMLEIPAATSRSHTS